MSKTTLSLALVTLLTTSTLCANSVNLAESLMKLRADVEQLDTSISEEKESYRSSIKSLLRQKDDLEAVIAKEELRIKQIEQELSKVRKEIVDASKSTEGLKPILLYAITLLNKNIQDSIDFKKSERLEDLKNIKTQIEQDLVSPQKGLALVWNAYTDALRMTKENGLFKQTITLNGQERLAEVARVGTVMMYFKTPNDEVGYVVKEGNGWGYKEVINKEQKEQILALFDAFKKQIRTGYFTLPNALVMMENK
ncbi:MAG: DUF3450 family protein [Epsilonproteobacteria bacterium]|nr:DUF3450 family protein [Campylobacterota bacterium]